MPDTIKLYALAERVNGHEFVIVEPAGEAFDYWRSRGYGTEEERAEAEQAAKEARDNAFAETLAEDATAAAPEQAFARRGRPRKERA